MQDEGITSTNGGQSQGSSSQGSFSEISIPADLVELLAKDDIRQPTPTQLSLISAVLTGKDVVAQMEKGSGKSSGLLLALAARRGQPGGAAARFAVLTVTAQDAKVLVQAAKKWKLPAVLQSELVEGETPEGIVVGTGLGFLEQARSTGVRGFKGVYFDELDSSLSEQLIDELVRKFQAVDRPQLVLVSTQITPAQTQLFSRLGQDPVLLGVEAQGLAQAVEASHIFYSLGADLLSKPNALCDVIEAEGRPATIIFCNMPSDTDMVEAMLNKRGIIATKLIGNVPQQKVTRALRDMKQGDISALVVTDIGARYVEVEDLDLVVNYSIPEDPEIYLHRVGQSGKGGRLYKIISFVSPLDISNFHYLRKLCGFQFQEGTLPTREEIARAHVSLLHRQAASGAHLANERVMELARDLVKEGVDVNLLGLLLYNTLEVLPNAQPASGGRESYRESYEERGDRDRGRHERGGRGDRRGGRGRQDRGDDDGYSRDDYRHEREEREPRPERQPRPAPVRDIRIYLGHGSLDGFSEGEFQKIVREKCDVSEDQIKRFSLRKRYAFADFSEEAAPSVLAQLEEATRDDGSKVFALKAASISGQREDEDGGEAAAAGGDE